MKRVIAALACSIILFSTTASAQDAPQPPAQITKLQYLVGTWHGTVVGTLGGQSVSFPLKHVFTKIQNGFGLKLDESGSIPAFGRFTSTNLMGYDAGEQKMHIYTITSFGDIHDHKGTMDGNTARLVHEGIVEGGKKYVEVLTITFSANEYSFTDEVTVDGQMTDSIKGTMKRGK